jgi:preprotein translocase subunit SecG
MIYLVTTIHVIVCFFLIIVVLLQHGKSGDIAAAFGGMGSQTAFGPRGAATVLSKATTWAAIMFMLTSITLSIFAARRPSSSSVLQGAPTQKSQPAPQKAPVNLPSSDPTSPTPPKR